MFLLFLFLLFCFSHLPLSVFRLLFRCRWWFHLHSFVTDQIYLCTYVCIGLSPFTLEFCLETVYTLPYFCSILLVISVFHALYFWYYSFNAISFFRFSVIAFDVTSFYTHIVPSVYTAHSMNILQAQCNLCPLFTCNSKFNFIDGCRRRHFYFLSFASEFHLSLSFSPFHSLYSMNQRIWIRANICCLQVCDRVWVCALVIYDCAITV